MTNESLLIELSEHPVWLTLIGYQNSKSRIISKAFFLSPEGHTDSFKELKATLQAFTDTKKKNANDHPQCKFRGRFTWLKTKLNFTKLAITPVDCPAFLTFSNNEKLSSLSLIFASGYLGNPASYYGHLLIKLNKLKSNSHETLVDNSINYGAAFPKNEKMLVYIIKGITGGYRSQFTQQQFYYHLHNYNDGQFRDLWEYELNLLPEQNQLLTAHIWEMLNVEHQYYFFNRNCAYRVAELLQVITEKKLAFAIKPWETPQAIMQRIGKLDNKGIPIVKKINYIPSRQSKLYRRFLSLNKAERKLVKQVVSDSNTLNTERFNRLNNQHKTRSLDTLIDYYKFIGSDKDDIDANTKEKYYSVLSKRIQQPATAEWSNFNSKNKPHLGHKPSYTSLGMSYHNKSNYGVFLKVRPAYYDALDSEFGQTKNSALSMGEFTLAFSDSELFIKRISIVSIESIGQNITRLPNDNTHSWGLSLGAEQDRLGCNDCLSFSTNAYIGYHYPILGETIGLTTQVGSGYIGQNLSNNNLHIDGLTRINLNFGHKATFQFENINRFFISSGENRNILSIKARIPLSRQTDARFTFTRDKKYESMLSLGFYW